MACHCYKKQESIQEASRWPQQICTCAMFLVTSENWHRGHPFFKTLFSIIRILTVTVMESDRIVSDMSWWLALCYPLFVEKPCSWPGKMRGYVAHKLTIGARDCWFVPQDLDITIYWTGDRRDWNRMVVTNIPFHIPSLLKITR